MEKEDFLMSQLNQMTRIIAQLILNIRTKTLDSETTLAEINSTLDFDFEQIINDKKFVSNLFKDKRFDDKNLELLADLIHTFASKISIDKKVQYLQKAVEIYEYLNNNSKIFSIERNTKIQNIKNLTQ